MERGNEATTPAAVSASAPAANAQPQMNVRLVETDGGLKLHGHCEYEGCCEQENLHLQTTPGDHWGHILCFFHWTITN